MTKVENLEKLLRIIENRIDGSKIELTGECPGEYEMSLRGFTVRVRNHGGNEYLLTINSQDKEINLEIETSKKLFGEYRDKVRELYYKMRNAKCDYEDIEKPLKKADETAKKILKNLEKGSK